MLRLLAPDAIAAGARAAREGHRQGQATGDQPDLTELVNWWRGQQAAA